MKKSKLGQDKIHKWQYRNLEKIKMSCPICSHIKAIKNLDNGMIKCSKCKHIHREVIK